MKDRLINGDGINFIKISAFALMLSLFACSETDSEDSGASLQGESLQGKKAVYVLVDTSGVYNKQFDKVQTVLRYLLRTLQPGDSLALARIDSISFSEKDIVARMTFDMRPSMTNSQKRAFLEMINNYSKDIRLKKHTDITGGALQAIEYLNETGVNNKYVVIFSELKEETREDHVRSFPVSFSGINVITIDASQLQDKNSVSKKYKKRLEHWKEKVETGSGSWKVIADLSKLDSLLD